MKKIKLERSSDSESDEKEQAEMARLSVDSIHDDNLEDADNLSSSVHSLDSPNLSHQQQHDDDEQSQQHHLNQQQQQPQRSPSPPLTQQQLSQQQQQQQQPQNNQTSIQRAVPGAPANFCNICNKELCNKYFMKTHMQKMHGINLDEYPREAANSGGVVCDICQKELCSKYFLKVHKSNTHGISDFNSGSASSQAANAATAVAAIALTNSLNNAQKRAALNLALNQHQLQSRQAAALMNAAAASAAFNPLQIQAAKAAAIQQQQQTQQNQQQKFQQRNQMSQASFIISQLQSQQQQHLDQQQPARSNTPPHLNTIHQNAQHPGEISSQPSPTSTSSPMNLPVSGLNVASFPAALLAASAATNNPSLLAAQLSGQEHSFSPYVNIATPMNNSPQLESQIQHQFMTNDDNQLDSDEETSDRDSLVDQQQEQNKSQPTLEHFQQQFQNQQAIFNAVAFGPAAAVVALQQQQQQQQQRQQQQQQQSILNDSARQTAAMDLRSPSMNQLLLHQVAASQRDQQLLNTMPTNNTPSRIQEPHLFHQGSAQAQQRPQQKHRNQRRRANLTQRTNAKRESQEGDERLGGRAESERIHMNLPNALISLAVQQAQQAAATRHIGNESTQNCTTPSHSNNGIGTAALQSGNSNNSRYLRHYTEACPICDRRFKSIKWLQSHVMNDHKNEIGNLFNLLVQVLLCGNGGNNNANANSGVELSNNLVNNSRPGVMDRPDDNTSGTGNTMIGTLIGASSLPTPVQQQSPPITGAQNEDMGSLGGLSGTLASLIGLQQQIQTLQQTELTNAQHQRLGMALSQAALPVTPQQALSTPSIATMSSANNRGNT